MGLLNVSEFKEKISKPAISSKYEVEIGIPVMLIPSLAIDGISPNFNKTLKFLCHETSIPSMNINTIKVFHRGNPFIMRGALSFSDTWSIKFYNTDDMYLHTFFTKWMYSIDQFDNLIIKSTFLGNYVGFSSVGAGYMNDAKLHIKNPSGETKITYKINYIFPIEVSEIELNSKESSSITSTEVKFAYSMFKKEESFIQELL